MYQVVIFCLSLCLVSSTPLGGVTESRFFSDLKRAIEIEVVGSEIRCYVHGDGDYIHKIIVDPATPVVIVNSDDMNKYIETCDEANNRLSHEEYHQNIVRKKRFVIYPGTKWCGTGNSADNYDDLGLNNQTDKCCRAHDNCPLPSIAPLSSRYGLTNLALWYKGHCTCDNAFYSCLKNVKGEQTADNVGTIFFNTIAVQCIQETGNTVRSCVRRRWWFGCAEYATEAEMEFVDATPY